MLSISCSSKIKFMIQFHLTFCTCNFSIHYPLDLQLHPFLPIGLIILCHIFHENITFIRWFVVNFITYLLGFENSIKGWNFSFPNSSLCSIYCNPNRDICITSSYSSPLLVPTFSLTSCNMFTMFEWQDLEIVSRALFDLN